LRRMLRLCAEVVRVSERKRSAGHAEARATTHAVTLETTLSFARRKVRNTGRTARAGFAANTSASRDTWRPRASLRGACRGRCTRPTRRSTVATGLGSSARGDGWGSSSIRIARRSGGRDAPQPTGVVLSLGSGLRRISTADCAGRDDPRDRRTERNSHPTSLAHQVHVSTLAEFCLRIQGRQNEAICDTRARGRGAALSV
jgi:hypothetical protein